MPADWDHKVFLGVGNTGWGPVRPYETLAGTADLTAQGPALYVRAMKSRGLCRILQLRSSSLEVETDGPFH